MDLGFLDFVPDFTDPRIVNAYDELPLWSAMFGLLLLEEVPLANIGTALDVGCGTGFPLIELADRLGAKSHVHGLDPWREALARAAEKMTNRGVTNVTLHEGSAAKMPFDAGTFDLIVSNLGLNNFDDRRAAIDECRRVSKRGAVLALTTNLVGHMAEFYDAFEAVLTKAGPGSNDAALARLKTHVAHRATVESVIELLEAGGFTIAKIVERHAWMRFTDGAALLNHHFIKFGFLDAWKKVVPDSERETFAQLGNLLDQRARAAGELRLTIPMAYIEATV
jgi:ubiquinone/menaquinone biosynthesis C-methylase UbiE